MIETIATDSPKVVGLRLSGKLHDTDYQQLVPTMETILTAAGKVRLLIQFEHEFLGWDWHAWWDDFKFGLKHGGDFERIAIVGDRTWERWMASFYMPFTQATVKYFDQADLDAAWAWLREEETAAEQDRRTSSTYDDADYYRWFGL
jgi:hypothetical protein